MSERTATVKKIGIVLMAIGGCLLFTTAMLGPALEPPVDTQVPALISLSLIALGLVVVLLNRRRRP
jgi:hypothetical protein